MVDFGKVLVSLLARAYIAEFSEEEVISETLTQISDARFWDSLFGILKDSEIHRQMIEEIVNLLQFDIKDFKEYSVRSASVKSYEFSDEFIPRMLDEILKLEVWSANYYSQLLKFDLSTISREYGEDVADKIKGTLQKLVTWEKKHAEAVRKLQDEF